MTVYRPDTPELEAAFNLLRSIYWREYGRGWRETIAKIRNVAADTSTHAECAAEQSAPKTEKP